MPDQAFNQLLDFGGIGILAMFLVWQHIKLTARQDKTAEEYRASLEKLAGKYDAEV